MLLILGLMLLGGAVFLVGEVATLPARQRQSSVRRAATYGRFRLPGAAPQLRFRERVVAPASSKLAELVLKLNPRVTVESVRMKLLAAGLANKIQPNAFLALKGAAAAGGLFIGFLLGVGSSPMSAFLFALVFCAVGFFGPDFVVGARARSRKEKVRAELPDALDLLAVSVEAGMGFDGAISKLTEHMDGALSEEFGLTLGEMRIGESRQDALKKMAERIDTPELAAFAVAAAVPSGGAATKPPRFSRVVVVVMENKDYGAVIGSRDAPYVTGLARRYALATGYFGVAHPSLPNYLALLGGSTFGITSDCTGCRVSAPNLVDELERRGISWRAYMEGMPSACFTGGSAGRYAKKHNPFVYFEDVVGSPARCAQVVPLTRLAGDLRARRLPRFVWITPDLCHDMHDCDVATGDRFLAGLLPHLLRALGPRGVLFLTWDEGVGDAGCCGKPGGGRIPTIVAGPAARRGVRAGVPLDHYSLLRTVEDGLGLRRLGASGQARPLTPLLRARP